MFRILKSEYPHLNFGVDSESTFHIVEELEEEEDGEIVGVIQSVPVVQQRFWSSQDLDPWIQRVVLGMGIKVYLESRTTEP
jgi:hypothetical protein